MAVEPDYVADRLREVHSGKRSWNLQDMLICDVEAFRREVVAPLRYLRDTGKVKNLIQHYGMYSGIREVDRVEIN